MKKMIISVIVLVISILILVNSIIQAEMINPNLWWQVIGMAIITFVVARDNWDQYQKFHKHQQK